ncbi:MAG: DUF4013 domain-containing protein [bacterium]|nr:DUF4013 domain-containing protein [bacterium]
MDIARSLRFPSRNPNWLFSLVVWALLMLGVVTAPLAIGYLVRVVRNVARGNEFLPSYADKIQLYGDGLRVWLAGAFFVLPIIAAILINEFCGNPLRDSDAGLLSFFAACGSAVLGQMLQSIYLAILVFLMPLIFLCVAYSPNWYAGFNFALMRRLLTNHVFDYVFMVLVAYAVSSLGSLGFFAFIIGAMITIPYVTFCVAHMYGSFLLQSLHEDDV